MSELLERIRLKCTECGDCWLWLGAGKDKVPVMRHGEGRALIPVRRLVLESRGIRVGHRLAAAKCGSRACVSPAHAAALTRAQLQQLTTDLLQYQKRPSRNAKISAERRRRAALDLQKVQEIRASDLPQRALAKHYGVAQSTIGDALMGNTWQDYSGPFAGLLAANDREARQA